MTNSPGLTDIKQILLTNPSKEMLTEIINNAQITNPLIKSMVFMAISTMKQEELARFAKIAVAAIQYVEAGNVEGLNNLCKRTGIPEPIISVITGYAANYIKQ